MDGSNIWLLAGGAALEGGKTFWGGVLEIDVWGGGLEAYRLALLPVPRRSEQSSLVFLSQQPTAASLAASRDCTFRLAQEALPPLSYVFVGHRDETSNEYSVLECHDPQRSSGSHCSIIWSWLGVTCLSHIGTQQVLF